MTVATDNNLPPASLSLGGKDGNLHSDHHSIITGNQVCNVYINNAY